MTAYDDALDRQIAAARKSGAPVVLTPGTITRPHVVDGCDLTGAGTNCAVSVAPGLTGPPLRLANTWNDNRRPVARGFLLHGPGSLTLGQKTARCDGLSLECQCFIEGVRVEYFDTGFVWACPGGHIRQTGCTATRCYYGVYCSVAGGDYAFDYGYLDGNAMASVGMPGSVGIEGMSLRQTHGGFSPYGIYQEAVPPGQTPARFFLQDCNLDQFRMEECGNGFLRSEWRGQDGGARCSLRDTAISQPGCSYADAYRLPGTPRVGVYGDMMDGRIVIDGGAHPFLPGDDGRVFDFGLYTASIPGYGASIALDGKAMTALGQATPTPGN